LSQQTQTALLPYGGLQVVD